MNFISSNSTSGYRLGARSGLSIIEVLTSVVVAMIGVFGVLALIPFAVKQASLGLDSDAAVTTARNAISQMEITGMQFPQNWANSTGGYNPFGPADDPPRIFSLDPLGIAEIANSLGRDGVSTAFDPADYTSATFPFRLPDVNSIFPTQQHPDIFGDVIEDLGIQALTFSSPAGGVFDVELARRMCRAGNDLVFNEPDTSSAVGNLSGPVALFDSDGRRQSQGRISWSAIVVPFKTESLTMTDPGETARWSYRMYILVYKDRQFTQFVSDSDPGGAMRVAQLDPNDPGNTGLKSPLGTVVYPLGVEAPVVLTGGIKRDDWVLLINRMRNWTDDGPPPTNVAYAEKGFDRQLAFCRVVNFADEEDFDDDDPNNNIPASITLDGPDFDFGNPSDTSDSSVIRETYIVHLKDVLGVYERTFTPELESNWNLSL